MTYPPTPKTIFLTARFTRFRAFAQGCWPKEWADNGILADITFLELFPVVISVHIWGIHLKKLNELFLMLKCRTLFHSHRRYP
jgi:hypothetical protein